MFSPPWEGLWPRDQEYNAELWCPTGERWGALCWLCPRTRRPRSGRSLPPRELGRPWPGDGVPARWGRPLARPACSRFRASVGRAAPPPRGLVPCVRGQAAGQETPTERFLQGAGWLCTWPGPGDVPGGAQGCPRPLLHPCHRARGGVACGESCGANPRRRTPSCLQNTLMKI